MTVGGDVIEAEIDLRSSWNGIRDQGLRPTCLVCATSDAHAHLHNCAPLSAEYLFYQSVQHSAAKDPTAGLTFEEAAHALVAQGQPSEHEWPYSPTQPDPWLPPKITVRWFGVLTKATVNAIEIVSKSLEMGYPVVLGIRLTAAFLAPSGNDFTIPAAGPGFGGHAVLAVGLGRRNTGEKYFLIRNSWGNTWADGGHAWLACGYLADKLIGYSRLIERLA